MDNERDHYAEENTPAKKSVAPISIARGDTLDRIIFPASRKPMDRRDLHVALEPILRAWIRAACTWDTLAIGDYRFVVFAIDVAPETQVYVQLWSEPFEPVLWEVSSGRWNPPADEWLAGDRAARIEAAGFTIGGNAENYHREVLVKTAADIAALAKAVVRSSTRPSTIAAPLRSWRSWCTRAAPRPTRRSIR